jgi:hypothetical protein
MKKKRYSTGDPPATRLGTAHCIDDAAGNLSDGKTPSARDPPGAGAADWHRTCGRRQAYGRVSRERHPFLDGKRVINQGGSGMAFLPTWVSAGVNAFSVSPPTNPPVRGGTTTALYSVPPTADGCLTGPPSLTLQQPEGRPVRPQPQTFWTVGPMLAS